MMILDAWQAEPRASSNVSFLAGISSSARSIRGGVGGARLACLEGEAAAERFFSWAGWSGKRYVVSVFPKDPKNLDPENPAIGLPDLGPGILIAVARHGTARVKRGMRVVERASDWSRALAEMSHGIEEWHVHLLAQDRPARAMALADLEGKARLAVVA